MLPELYYRLGKLAADTDDPSGAAAWFEQTIREAAHHPAPSVRENLTILSDHARGVVAWRARDYAKALEWMRRAQEDVLRWGRNDVPDLAAQIAVLERLAVP